MIVAKGRCLVCLQETKIHYMFGSLVWLWGVVNLRSVTIGILM